MKILLKKLGDVPFNLLLKLAKSSTLESPSLESLKWEATGQKLTDVVNKAYIDGFKVQSNFARENAVFVAQAASLYYITTRRPDNYFDNTWRITSLGLGYLSTNVSDG